MPEPLITEREAVNTVLVGTLAGLALFVGRKIWPFVIKQYERQAVELAASHATNQKLIQDFMEALARRDQEFGKLVLSMDRLAVNVERLTTRIERLEPPGE